MGVGTGRMSVPWARKGGDHWRDRVVGLSISPRAEQVDKRGRNRKRMVRGTAPAWKGFLGEFAFPWNPKSFSPPPKP